MIDPWMEAHRFLLNLKVGEGYKSGSGMITVTKRTDKQIVLSTGLIIRFKKIAGWDSKSTGNETNFPDCRY